MIYILASTKRAAEFDTANAINAMGGLAVVPRKVEVVPAKDGKPERMEYRPLLSRMLFLACTESQWHQMQTERLFGPQGILPPIKRDLFILPRTWGDFQAFAQRSEQECAYRIEMHEMGRKVRNYRKGDLLRIIGGELLDGQLRDRFARFVKLDKGKVVAETDVMMMGRPVVARLDPTHVTALAAE